MKINQGSTLFKSVYQHTFIKPGVNKTYKRIFEMIQEIKPVDLNWGRRITFGRNCLKRNLHPFGLRGFQSGS